MSSAQSLLRPKNHMYFHPRATGYTSWYAPRVTPGKISIGPPVGGGREMRPGSVGSDPVTIGLSINLCGWTLGV